jgi:CheY-like chemotaxis protein
MNTFDEFETALRDALMHLRDAHYQAPDVLFEVSGCSPDEGSGPLQTFLLSFIDTLTSNPDTPPDSHAWRVYDCLHKRFILGLSQEEVAECLHMSVRHLQRVQMQALRALAQRIWAQCYQARARDAVPGALALDWRSQARLELASLLAATPDAQAVVTEVIAGVLAVYGQAMGSKAAPEVKVLFVQPDLVSPVHPSALQQLLIGIITRLPSRASGGQTTIHATLEDGQVKITIASPVGEDAGFAVEQLETDLIVPPGTAIETNVRAGHVYCQIITASIGQRTVLVVDDNADVVHYYRRCTVGTSYRIVPVSLGQGLLKAVEDHRPAIIVLDVMLPDIDGWQLLTHLHEHPLTRSTPVIVCSVVKEEALALALGATIFLAKPVEPERFVEALDQVLRPTSA